MSNFSIGDLVVLKSGSMRMCVEVVDGDMISTVWCNEGIIGRETFNVVLLNKWEYREDSNRGGDRGGPRGGDRGDRGDRHGGGGKPYGGDRDGGGKRFGGGDRGDRGGHGGGRDRDGDDRPPRKTGWDGKPRDKKFYRKDD